MAKNTNTGGQPEEFETEFHYPQGKMEEETVSSSQKWASSDFDVSEFDFDLDAEDFDESEFGEADYGEDYEDDLTDEEWAEIEAAYGVNADGHVEENLCTVAVVGRPNVGKSSLVNRFLGRREAVVEDHPGVTRDRISYVAEWNGRRFLVQDTGGWDPNVKGIHAAIARQAEAAMETADVIVFVVDTRVGITETDSVMAKKLQKSQVPVILVSNKFDSDNMYADMAEFYALGLGDPWPVSAQHGRGGADVLDEILRLFPDQPRHPSITSGPRRVALVGKPNVGKSSLLNALSGNDRAIVTDIAGTTRDVIEEYVNLDGIPLILTDTAGIHETDDTIERLGVERSKKSIDEADLVLAVLDGSGGLSDEDKEILKETKGKNRIIIINKTDLGDRLTDIDESETVIRTSAVTGSGLKELAAEIKRIYKLGQIEQSGGAVITNMRHKKALDEAYDALSEAAQALESGMPADIASIDINAAIRSLGEITGETVSESIVSEIFHNFCVGK